MYDSRTHFSYRPAVIALATLMSLGLVAFGGMSGAFAADPGDDDFLGTAESFAIIASDTVTDAVPSSIQGDVGLTATPGKQTFGFFNQNLVMEYPYEQAVADGVNVDFDV